MMPNKTTAGFDARGYMRDYITQNIVYKHINFARSKPEDQKMLEWLEAREEGISPYIKRLIYEDMLKHQK